MRKRVRVVLVSAMTALTLLLGEVAVASQSAVAAAPAAPASVKVMAKVILNETSVNAPGFYANANLGAKGAIAWAGTDSLHHLNVMTSSDGLHYGHKVILGELSVNRPAVTQMSVAAGGAVALAWRGTDPAHRLNVLFDVYGSRKKWIFNETSFTGPALTVYRGNLLLAWVGTDANHSLNVLPISLSNFKPGVKTTLWSFHSSAGPTLTAILDGPQIGSLVMGWLMPSGKVNLAQTTDGVHFSTALGVGLPQYSVSSPTALHYNTEGGPEYWLAWTGTDTYHRIAVQWTTHYPQWPTPSTTKTLLPEWALGGPTIGFEEGVVMAWTGTDPTHHLNVARLEGF